MKLIVSPERKNELFDLLTDPNEEHDLMQEQRETAEVLQSALKQWEEELPRRLHKPAQLNKIILERLKSLGYVQ